MSIKTERINKIKLYLRMQSSAVTVTEIHEALLKRMNLKNSRKTIERDVYEMVEAQIISCNPGIPSRYLLNKPMECEVILKVEEIQSILQLLDPGTELYLKLKKLISL